MRLSVRARRSLLCSALLAATISAGGAAVSADGPAAITALAKVAQVPTRDDIARDADDAIPEILPVAEEPPAEPTSPEEGGQGG